MYLYLRRYFKEIIEQSLAGDKFILLLSPYPSILIKELFHYTNKNHGEGTAVMDSLYNTVYLKGSSISAKNPCMRNLNEYKPDDMYIDIGEMTNPKEARELLEAYFQLKRVG